jgi:hypothetical protein
MAIVTRESRKNRFRNTNQKSTKNRFRINSTGYPNPAKAIIQENSGVTTLARREHSRRSATIILIPSKIFVGKEVLRFWDGFLFKSN